MRTYRLEIRVIQAAIALALIVLITGFFGLWGKAPVPAPAGGTGTASQQKGVLPPAIPLDAKVVALGDSFTQGYPPDVEHSWTQRLADDLKLTVENKGKGQQTSKDLLARFDQDVAAEKPGSVIIFAGTGDALQNVSLTNVQTNIQAMVEKAKADNIVPVLALPVWYPGYQSSILEIRDWEKNYAQSQSLTCLDFTSVLYGSDKNFLDGLSDDGKYPNVKGNQVMGDYAAKVLKGA